MEHLPAAVPGRVYIVGAGPGDPGLITMRGAGLLAGADVVLYDDLLDTRLLDLTRPECEHVYAGHRGGRDGRGRQDEINTRLIAEARAGRRVVRLKGGDPYVFGRGGEEALALREAGIPFEVVSGVSAACGVLASAGIPLTHRHVAATATIVTGHEAAEGTPAVDWQALARLGGTLVVFMGSRRLAAIAQALLDGGRSGDTPAAAVEWGTWPAQRTLVATLDSLADRAAAAGVTSPALIVIGEVVTLRGALSWFESRPLSGRRLLITRSLEQNGALRSLLEAEGAEVHALPLLEIGPPADGAPLDAALRRLVDFSWVVFTSPNAVRFTFDGLRRIGADARAFGARAHASRAVRLAAVGGATAQALRDRGLEPDLVPETQSAAGLAAAFAHHDLREEQVLIPASSIGRTELDEGLAAQGAVVARVTAYENRSPAPESVVLPEALTGGRLDGVVFASPSAARSFLDVIGAERGMAWLRAMDIAVIGPTTAQAVRDLDLEVAVQPEESSLPALVSALCEQYGQR